MTPTSQRKYVRLSKHTRFPVSQVADIDAELLGVRTAKLAEPYLERDVDQAIDSNLENRLSAMIVVTGDPMTGKSRTAVEAIRRRCAGYLLLAPRTPADLPEILKVRHRLGDVVYWLDPLEDFVGPENLSLSPLGEFHRTVRGHTVLVGTARTDRLRPFQLPPFEQQWDSWSKQYGFLHVELTAELSAAERELAGSENPPWSTDMTDGGADTVIPQVDPWHLAAVAAAEGRRAVAIETLTRITEPDTTVQGTLGRLLAEAGQVKKAARLLRAAANQNDRYAMLHLGILLSEQDDPAALDLLRKVRWNFPEAARRAGLLLARLGNPKESMELLHEAAREGDSEGLRHYLLSSLELPPDTPLSSEIEQKAAEPQALPEVINNVGVHYERRGRAMLSEAMSWYRRAAEDGDLVAANNLGILCSTLDMVEEAETWLGKVADSGEPGGLHNLGMLLERQGRISEAEELYRRAWAGGVTEAADSLGQLALRRGDAADAEHWFRESLTSGDPGAAAKLGELLLAQGRDAEAEDLFLQSDVLG
jgi:TPR repeat protein